MENPSNSYFWLTCWVKELLLKVITFETNFQVCMFGGSRDKWTKILATFKEIETMNVRCNRQHTHAAWGFAFNDEGQHVWAISLESRYPRKMCVVLTQLVLQIAEKQELQLPATDLTSVDSNPLKTALHSQVGAQRQPNRLPPLVPDFSSVATFLCEDVSTLPCTLQSKLPAEWVLHTRMGLLRISAFQPDHDSGVGAGGQAGKRARKSENLDAPSTVAHSELGLEKFPYEVAFGLPWKWEDFVCRACASQHPFLQDVGAPDELSEAIDFHMDFNDEQICIYRLDWCKKWLKRSKDLRVRSGQTE